ncbi:hypothetical protein BKA70DRAFT_1131896 [Coprinopsis sp. MPI-PUGE-AT-0042]|nr:hypothetical protein BKA70DRAFT_1131896 [Coprinopsis sp. MPI-PUGE-AT-0042]
MSQSQSQIQQQASSFGFPSQQQQDGSNSLNPNTNNLNVDPNSTILFTQNLAHAQREVVRLQTLARQALDGVKNAYHVGYSPEATAEIMVELKSALRNLVNALCQSGVGALPLIAQSTPPPTSAKPTVPPSEPELLQIGTKQVQVLYEQLKAKQESAGVVANLLGVAGGDSSQGRR